MKKQEVIYTGTLAAPKGKKSTIISNEEQLIFRSTSYGDDMDRTLQKSNGEFTYFASDAAYFLSKLERGFNHMLLELGADHVGYKKRMEALVSALSGDKAKLIVVFHGLVKFVENSIPIKMSKRAGQFLSISEVLEKVDKDILRFVMLTRSNDAPLEFDMEKVKEQTKDNPVFYVQYAYARIFSVLRSCKRTFFITK